MQDSKPHSFHIPVMGLGYTLETPLKVAKFGISSVVSIMDDSLLEDMRRVKSRNLGVPYFPINTSVKDSRALRITAYLNFLHEQIENQINLLKSQFFGEGNDLDTYFELLSDKHPAKKLFENLPFLNGEDRVQAENQLKAYIQGGKIDVNIMTKVDKLNFDEKGEELPREFSDALSALRGFANSKLNASVVFSAGMNPALYSYAEQFDAFFPDHKGDIRKRIILKVSDYRSAMIQGRFLAKKGLWVSEFRIESGLNCGGHAFATDGILLGPIFEEFKENRENLNNVLLEACNQALLAQGKPLLLSDEKLKITVQGGIGTALENEFLLDYYRLDGTGWGSPFLMVPEATNVDDDTLQKLVHAKKSDYYLSHASPLGVRFNNLRTSSSEDQRKKRINKDRAGSPCYKKFLSFNTEFTEKPICTASRQYLNLKMKEMKSKFSNVIDFEKRTERFLAKDCLCEGLGAPALLTNGEIPARNLTAVTICPGPNLAYFSGVFSLKEMVGHIYGKISILRDSDRPHMFVKELQLYISYLKEEIDNYLLDQPAKFEAYVDKFKANLKQGVAYYQRLIEEIPVDTEEMISRMKNQFQATLAEIEEIAVPSLVD
ncbi:hypothetical protein Belba_2607 [Belliella baltica DSM 15883]|uniref:Uncharacterized protein n=1 Tax=Belliella baltica (strain DSM 15883 / CIP 108006 / LMG 21964 / BA134) TaxID=866536 RepID=I3Z7D4_BELBD|nr:hypothetical protein [Belliella baltica]AFL85152.1 hypothetical protein Belba_2607 [Belliella baltica DSM 15883]